MINAQRILLFSNAEAIPGILRDYVRSWELAEYAEDLAGRIAKSKGKKIVLGLKLVPTKKRPSSSVTATTTFKTQYRKAIEDGMKDCDGIAIIPGLMKASEIPDWLYEMAEERYIPIAGFGSFFSDGEGSDVYKETSRKRIELAGARLPMGREGRGGRVK